MKLFTDFYEAYNWLEEHPIFMYNYNGTPTKSMFNPCLVIQVIKVNPENLTIDDNVVINTKVQVWLECGPYLQNNDQYAHDIYLDCGADTFELAIIELANNVKKYYGSGKCKKCEDRLNKLYSVQ